MFVNYFRIHSFRGLLTAILIIPLMLTSCNSRETNTDSTLKKPQFVIVDASDLYDYMAREHKILESQSLNGAWLFNNSAIKLGLRSRMQGSVNVQTRVNIPASGKYYLFVRTAGPSGSSLKVAVGEQFTDPIVNDTIFTWRNAGSMELEEGEESIWLTRIHRAPVFDVLVLTPNENFNEEDILEYQYQGRKGLLKEYDVGFTDCVKFGDLESDGKMDILVFDPNYSATVYNHEGEAIWKYESSEEGSRFRASENEGPGAVWDLDQDGFAEVVHWRFMEGKEWLVVAEGMTGEIRHRIPWPCPELPHAYNNFRIAIARLHPGYADNIILFTDAGNDLKTISAYTSDLELLWQVDYEMKKDHLGHYPYALDLDGDGIDEVVMSALVLDAKGNVVWERFDLFNDNHDHADSYRFVDITGDGKPEMLAAMSDLGIVVFDAADGSILWQHVAEHSQQIESGDFLADHDGPQIAISARYYGNQNLGQDRIASEIHWFDKKGNFLSKWPANAVPGNPDFVKGNWMGDGKEVLFWGRFMVTGDGRGKLYFPDYVYHMFDFNGNGADEVITIGDDWIRVYGAENVKASGLPETDIDILRQNITNHTHY